MASASAHRQCEHHQAFNVDTLAEQALSFCGRQYVSPSVPATPSTPPAPRAGAKLQDDDASSDSEGDEAAAAPAPYVSAMRRTEAAAANRAQVRYRRAALAWCVRGSWAQASVIDNHESDDHTVVDIDQARCATASTSLSRARAVSHMVCLADVTT